MGEAAPAQTFGMSLVMLWEAPAGYGMGGGDGEEEGSSYPGSLRNLPEE